MSQVVGQTYKSRIPTLGDDASIEEALRVYHYGVDNYTSQPIPNDSIEGNFRTFATNLATTNSNLSSLDSTTIKRISLSANPNILTAQTTTTVPLTIRQIVSQTSNLQEWRNSTNTLIANITSAGTLQLAGNLGIGTITATATTSLNIVLPSATQKGIVIRSAPSATGNLQEWQDSSATVLSYINSQGSFITSADIEVLGNMNVEGQLTLGGKDIENLLVNPLMLIGA